MRIADVCQQEKKFPNLYFCNAAFDPLDSKPARAERFQVEKWATQLGVRGLFVRKLQWQGISDIVSSAVPRMLGILVFAKPSKFHFGRVNFVTSKML